MFGGSAWVSKITLIVLIEYWETQNLPDKTTGQGFLTRFKFLSIDYQS